MKHTFLTLILALMAVTSFAQVPVLTAGGHLPRGGDRIERYCIDYVLPGDSGRNVLWNKSGLNVGKETLVSAYKYWSDSTFSEVLAGRVQYNYTISGDTVLCNGFEKFHISSCQQKQNSPRTIRRGGLSFPAHRA